MAFLGIGARKGAYEISVDVQKLPHSERRHFSIEFIRVETQDEAFPGNWKSPAIPIWRKKNTVHFLDVDNIPFAASGKLREGWYHSAIMGLLIKARTVERNERQDFFSRTPFAIAAGEVMQLPITVCWPEEHEMFEGKSVREQLDEDI